MVERGLWKNASGKYHQGRLHALTRGPSSVLECLRFRGPGARACPGQFEVHEPPSRCWRLWESRVGELNCTAVFLKW